MSSLAFKIYHVVVMILGNLFLLSIIINIINRIIIRIKVAKDREKFKDIISKSDFVRETLGPMTDAEKESMEKTGRAETMMDINMDDLNVVNKINVGEK